MNREFALVRLLAIFLVSAHGVLHALVAFRPPAAAELAAWTAGIGAATLLGQALYSRLSVLVEKQWRARLLGAVWIAYGSVLILTILSLTSGGTAGIPLLLLLQPLFLLFAGMGRGHIGAVRNAAILSAAAGVAGSWTAVAGFLAILPFFLVADHGARKLLQYPVDQAPGLGRALAKAALLALVPVAATVAFAVLVGVRPYERVPSGKPVAPVSSEQLWAAYRDLVIAVLAGGIVFYFVLRMLFGTRRDAGEVRVQVVPVARSAMEKRPIPAPVPEAAYSGLRGRIVRLYLRFVGEAARLGRRRRPDHTPAEYASQFPEPIGELTRLFERARYGPDDCSEADVETAREASARILESLRGGT